MNATMIQHLILKDFRLHRLHILLSIAGGGLALALLQSGGELPFILGTVWFFVALIVLGSMLPISNIINERKKQNLAFIMSLPVTAVQYSMSKILSTFGMFLVPWLTLVIAGVSLILGRGDIPNGVVPTMLILAGLPFVGFCMTTGTAIVSESEGWAIGATVASNSCYGFGWYLIARNPAMRADMGSPTAVWGPAALTILGSEFALIALILVVTLYIQSRKRDFI